jgi:DNA repair exonuclease SbcCD ATPase subunit
MSESSEKKPLSKLERARLAANQSTEQVLQQGEKNLEQLTQQAEQLKQAKIRDAEELALLIEPLCQTLVQLTEDTRQTFQALQREAKSAQQQRSKDQESYKQELEALSQNFQKRIQSSTENYNKAANQATSAARELEVAGQRLEWSHYLIAAMVSVGVTLFSTVFVQWLYPPKIENSLQIDTEKLLQRLKDEQEYLLGPPQDRPEKPSKTKKPKP